MLQFLGLGAAFYPALKNNSAFFTVNNDLYLLDCGETVFAQLWNMPALTSAEKITVVITHMHSDHMGSLATLIPYCYFRLKKPVTVLFPHEKITQPLAAMGIAPSLYSWIPASQPGDAVSFEPVEVEHIPNQPCFGYIISLGNEKIYYSGDAKFIPQKILDLFFEGSISKIYQDTALEEKNQTTHGSFAEMEKIFPLNVRSRVYCMHLDTDFRSLIIEKGFSLPPLV